MKQGNIENDTRWDFSYTFAKAGSDGNSEKYFSLHASATEFLISATWLEKC